jgi:hypothetical protein
VAWSSALNLFVAVANAAIMTSPDGITWTARTVPNDSSWSSVVWAPEMGVFIIVGSSGTAQRVATSSDGINWTQQSTPGAGAWYGVAWSPSLGVAVAVGDTTGTIQVMSNAAVQYDALTGVTGIVVPIPKGAPINIWVQRDDLTAQAAAAARDNDGGDGVYEAPPIVDERRNEASLTALLDAYLAKFSMPLVTVVHATRDINATSGKPQVFNLTSPAIHATLTIQDVVNTEIDIVPGLAPKKVVTSSSVRFSLESLLQKMAAKL